MKPTQANLGSGASTNWGAVVAVGILAVLAAMGLRPLMSSGEKKIDYTPAADLVALDKAVDWSQAKLTAVQDNGRYKTLDSFARESLSTMCGKEQFPGLTPIASAFEWLFNRSALVDTPLIYVKDRGIRIHFTAHMPAETAHRIREHGYMTAREFFDPTVDARKRELAPRSRMSAAMRRVEGAHVVASDLDELIRLVPRPEGPQHDLWVTPQQLVPNLPESMLSEMMPSESRSGLGPPINGISSEQAMHIVAAWSSLRAAWLRRDAAGVNESFGRLLPLLPNTAGPEGYPSLAQRKAEARYYSMGKFTGGWVTYYFGGIIAIWALTTRWKAPWWIGLTLLVIGLSFHAYGLGLRWYILGRIPVANMFEAVVASAWMGVAAGLALELIFRTRVFLLASHATGFMALMLGSFVIPGSGTLTTIRAILDDVMLRIHTTMIISSYALIFLAGVIAVVYLFGYYFHTARARSAEAGAIGAACGMGLMLLTPFMFREVSGLTDQISGFVKNPAAPLTFALLTAGCVGGLVLAVRQKAAGVTIAGLGLLCLAGATAAIGNRDFVFGMGAVLAASGLAWFALNMLGGWMSGAARVAPVGPMPALAGAGAAAGPWIPAPAERRQRPILAGGAPGDEVQRGKLPQWLLDFDWSHLIILNLVFVLLFVGIILGAVWADYSWGRPWGWDPKEVFALNTWIIYAILIHTRFVTANRGLWTAWLSVFGCLMMAFNWCFVNFFIVGLHSYA